MFAVLARPIARRSFGYTARCMATKKNTPRPPPPPPPPATNDAEEKPVFSSTVNLDILPEEPQPRPSQRTGARSSLDSLSSAERRRRRIGGFTTVLFVGFLGFQLAYMTRDWDESELQLKKWTVETAPSSRWGRVVVRFKDFLGLFSEPPAPELLPPQYPPPHNKPYTMVIEIDDLLTTATWDRQHGWRTAKRPGADYFLAYMSQFYEIVVFTRQYQYTAEPILAKLDQFQFFIMHRLFRDSMRSINGKTVKDLSYLNRDLSKVILLDTIPEHGAVQPENTIILPKWTGEPNDRGLIAMIPFLESLAIYQAPDVRPIITAYAGKDIPLEYAKKEAEAKQKHLEEWEKKKQTPNPIGAMFGLTSRAIPPTYLEAKRKEAQHFYKEEQAYIAKNKAHLEELMKKEQEMMMGQGPNNFWEMLEVMKNGPQALPPPPGTEPPPGPESPAEGKKPSQ